jgi:peptidoglycan/xylan/chitin deacetylase (PgdA/CDA1 family)
VSILKPIRQLGDRLSQPWQAQSRVDSMRALGAASKPWLRDGLADVLSRVGATSPARFARGALTIITFHRVLPEEKLRQYPVPGLVVTPEQLELVLGEITPFFEVTSVSEGCRAWRSGKSGSRPLLALSFDDGALDNFVYARPVLDRLGLRATFFVPVRNIEEGRAPWHDRLGFALLRTAAAVRKPNGVNFDRVLEPFGASVGAFAAILPDDALRIAQGGVVRAQRLPFEQREVSIQTLEAALGADPVPAFASMMSWDQVRELHRAGHEIGSHSLSHLLLPELSDARLKEEVEGSRRELSNALDADVASFCYPNGGHDARVVKAVQSAGYECAVTTRWGLNRKQPPFELARCDMDFSRLRSRQGEFSKERLWLRLSGLQPGLPEGAPD